MLDLIRTLSVFALIIILLRKKIHIGMVLILSSLFLGILYMMDPLKFIDASFKSLTSIESIKLFFALTFIRCYEMLLREKEILKNMMEASKRILRNRRLVIISMPLLIGMLPSLGGAYFSAPMVDESTKRLNLNNEEKAYINYWFRHPWELILPLYPGIVLASALTGIELKRLIMANILIAVSMLFTGFFTGLKKIPVDDHERKESISLRNDIISFLPILLILILVAVFSVELYISLGAGIIALLIIYRVGLKDILRIIRYGFTKDVFLLIAGVMLIKGIMDASNAVEGLNRYFFNIGVPPLMIAFILPFIAGLLTGLVVGFIGSTFPLIIAMSGDNLYLISFAFVSGYTGVLLSPVHLCLVLTREYFKADIRGIYKKLLPGISIMLGISIIIYGIKS